MDWASLYHQHSSSAEPPFSPSLMLLSPIAPFYLNYWWLLLNTSLQLSVFTLVFSHCLWNNLPSNCTFSCISFVFESLYGIVLHLNSLGGSIKNPLLLALQPCLPLIPRCPLLVGILNVSPFPWRVASTMLYFHFSDAPSTRSTLWKALSPPSPRLKSSVLPPGSPSRLLQGLGDCPFCAPVVHIAISFE